MEIWIIAESYGGKGVIDGCGTHSIISQRILCDVDVWLELLDRQRQFLYEDYMKRRGIGEMVVSSSRWEMATEREPAGDVFWWQRNREVKNGEYGTYLKYHLQEEYWIETAGVVMFKGRSNDID